MHRIAKLATATVIFAALFGCSRSGYNTSSDLGTVVLDFDDGPHVVDIHVELVVDDADDMNCRELSPSVRLDWSGDDGDVQLNIATTDEIWDEDAFAEDGLQLTAIGGTFRRCAFDATVVVTGAEGMVGAITATASASREDGITRGTLSGTMSADLLDAE